MLISIVSASVAIVVLFAGLVDAYRRVRTDIDPRFVVISSVFMLSSIAMLILFQ
jgi:hypothetical protein